MKGDLLHLENWGWLIQVNSACEQSSSGIVGSEIVGMVCMRGSGSSIQPLPQALIPLAGFLAKLSSRMG